jgi:hypothetical protein
VQGFGKLQIHCQDGNDLGKSDIMDFMVCESIVDGGEHPSETPSWAARVVEATGHYPKIENGNWYVWDVQNAEWSDTGVSAGGDVSPEQIEAAVEDYLDEHPITVTETDPTVPAWAKAPTKPTYTAAEVGALPSSYTPPVQSVNGKTGAVVLGASDVGALPSDTVIPPAVTEQTVAGWGFTKNTGDYTKPSGGIPDSDIASAAVWNAKGTYSKPSGGIPKTDLAADVQTSLGKADTALQQHQSLTGYATETWVEGKGYQTAAQVQSAIAAIPDELPTVTASDNGKSLVVENGVWTKGNAVPTTPRVAMTASDTTPTLNPNTFYVFPEMATLTPTLATPTDNSVVNEYHFIFDSGSTATVLTLPASVLQPDGFTVEANMHYEISILEGAMTAQGWAVTA